MKPRSWSPLAGALLVLAAAPPPAPPPAGPAAGGEVRAVSLVPAAGKAELVIQLRGAVSVTDFTLRDPNRIVLDLAGATLTGGLGRTGYDGVKRAGVLNVRISQYTPDVVRVVLDLERMGDYEVRRIGDEIRVVLGLADAFTAWSTGSVAPLAARLLADAEVTNELTDAAEPRSSPRAPVSRRPLVSPALGRGLQQRPEPRVTVSWDNANITEVVAGFQRVSGRSIILGKGITGVVTAEIIDQPWTNAFYAILSAQGLSAAEMPGGILRVDNPATLAEIDSLEPRRISIVKVNYARAGELANSVKGILSKRGLVTPDTATNSLIINEVESNSEHVRSFVEMLDIRPKQISIQAKIIFVDRTDLDQLGFKYDIGSQDHFYNRLVQRGDPLRGGQPFDPGRNIVNLGGNQVAAIGNAEAVLRTPAIELMFSTALGGFTLTSFLQALEQVDLSDVQAEPTITTADNVRASIVVGDEVPIRVIDANAPTGAGQAVRANVQYKETGIKLYVTPHVTNDGFISLDLETERSNLQPLAAADLGFVISKQTTRNRLLVEDGETAVIGGLTVTTVTKTRSGIPLLSTLPLIGSLFSYTSNVENRRDLIILVTPRVLEDPGTSGS